MRRGEASRTRKNIKSKKKRRVIVLKARPSYPVVGELKGLHAKRAAFVSSQHLGTLCASETSEKHKDDNDPNTMMRIP